VNEAGVSHLVPSLKKEKKKKKRQDRSGLVVMVSCPRGKIVIATGEGRRHGHR